MRTRQMIRGDGCARRLPGRVPDGRVPRGLFRRVLAVSGLVLVLAVSAGADDLARPAEDILRLVPPDATVVLTVEGLRDHARAMATSRLVSELRRLPVVQSWLDSDKYRRFQRSCQEIENVLGVKLTVLRDELLGDAVVLVLRLSPAAPTDPSQARGLLLLKARDRALLGHLIDAINTIQRDNGELARVVERDRAGVSYHVRQFPAGAGRESECYVRFPDGTFAFSNSESLIQSVIDRKGPSAAGRAGPVEGGSRKAAGEAGRWLDPGGLGDGPKLRAVWRRLPARALARLFIDPRPIERLLAAAPERRKPADPRIVPMLQRYLAAVDYAGAALVWDADAIAIHSVETLDPSRVDPWLRRWAADARRWNPAVRRIPPTALAIASAHLDLTALRAAVFQIVPEPEHTRLGNLEAVLTGLLLGQDFRTRILPGLGPGVIAYLDATIEATEGPDGPGPPARRGWLFPMVVVLSFSEEPSASRPAGDGEPPGRGDRSGRVMATVAAAMENALHTVLALSTLDEHRDGGRARIATRQVAGATVTTLDVPVPFAYAVDRVHGRLVLGTSAGAVTRYLEGWSDGDASGGFWGLQAAAFAGFETFLCIDFDAVTRLAGRYRDRLVLSLAKRQKRPVTAVAGDLDHLLALARLFRAAFVASRIEPDATAAYRTLGVILHHDSAFPPRQP